MLPIVSLYPCDPGRIQDLQFLAMQSYREHYLYLWENERYAEWYMNRSFSTASLQAQMSDPQSCFYFIRHRNRETGFVKLNWSNPYRNEPGSMELERMYLISEAAGQGIGSAAMQIIFSLAREQNKKMIWLKAMDSSPAVLFYQKSGFRITGTERLSFEGFIDAYRNMWVMQRKL